MKTDETEATMQGYVQVYTGNGKGKTTAALGLALRAAGAGLRVFFGQFAKAGDYSEVGALARFSDLVTVEQFGSGGWIKGKPDDEAIAAARRGLERASEAVRSGLYDVVVLDEANIATSFGLIGVAEVLELMAMKPVGVELVLTGRGADERIVERADLVTEMKEVKHYLSRGVRAREGIEK